MCSHTLLLYLVHELESNVRRPVLCPMMVLVLNLDECHGYRAYVKSDLQCRDKKVVLTNVISYACIFWCGSSSLESKSCPEFDAYVG